MVTTITVSTITSIATAGLGLPLGIIASILLIGVLAGRELLLSSLGLRQQILARSLIVAIIPLIIVFAVIVILKVTDILA